MLAALGSIMTLVRQLSSALSIPEEDCKLRAGRGSAPSGWRHMSLFPERKSGWCLTTLLQVVTRADNCPYHEGEIDTDITHTHTQ